MVKAAPGIFRAEPVAGEAAPTPVKATAITSQLLLGQNSWSAVGKALEMRGRDPDTVEVGP